MIQKYCSAFMLVMLFKTILSSKVQTTFDRIKNRFTPFNDPNTKQINFFENFSTNFYLETNGLSNHLICKVDIINDQNGLLFTFEKLPNDQGTMIYYVPIGKGFSFNVFATTMQGTAWLDQMNIITNQTPSERNYILSSVNLNQVQWNEQDLKVANENVVVPSSMRIHTDYSEDYILNVNHSKSMNVNFDFSPNDPVLTSNAQLFSSLYLRTVKSKSKKQTPSTRTKWPFPLTCL